jgi:hypothetical protein
VLGDLVAVTPAEQLTPLVDLIGGGALELRLALRVALARRAQSSPTDRAALLTAVDAAIPPSEPSRKAALIGVRAALTDGPDPTFTAQAIAWALDDTAAFVVRVAAAASPPRPRRRRGRADQPRPPSRPDTSIRRAGPSRPVRCSARWPCKGSPPPPARALVERHGLLAATAPRIASAAYNSALLASDGSWLTASQAHPWPEVRGAALTRVEGPCAAAMVKKLAQIADATARKGEAEAIVAREAIAALGRCGGDAARAALVRMLDDGDQDPERRAEAGRQLVKHHGHRGAAAVAAASARTPDVGLSIRLVRALQRSEVPPSAEVLEALCTASEADRDRRRRPPGDQRLAGRRGRPLRGAQRPGAARPGEAAGLPAITGIAARALPREAKRRSLHSPSHGQTQAPQGRSNAAASR